MSKMSEAVKRWRFNTKKLMIDSFGGVCCMCGYNRCPASMDFHHLDPSQKEFQIAKMMSRPRKWEYIVSELRKCVLLCRNCHGEIHSGIVSLPETARRFDETYALRKHPEPQTPCPVCGTLKSYKRKTCSKTCAAKSRSKIDWSKLEEMVTNNQTYVAIAESLGCSDSIVIRRLKRMGLYQPRKPRKNS